MDSNPFRNFTPKTAEKILELSEQLCVDEIDAAAHLSAALMALAPTAKTAKMFIEYVELMTKKSELITRKVGK